MNTSELLKHLKGHPNKTAKTSGEGAEIHVGWCLRGYWSQMVAPVKAAPAIIPQAMARKLLSSAPSIEILTTHEDEEREAIAAVNRDEVVRIASAETIIYPCPCGNPVATITTATVDHITLTCCGCGFCQTIKHISELEPLTEKSRAAFRRLMAGASKWAASLPSADRELLRESCQKAQSSKLSHTRYSLLTQTIEQHQDKK